MIYEVEMKFSIATILLATCLFFTAKQTQCARILAIIPIPSISHNAPFRPLWLELSKRGHDIVLVTSHPIPNINRTNFVQIDISDCFHRFGQIDWMQMRFENINNLQFQKKYMTDINDVFSHNVLNNTQVKKLYAPDSDAKFDVVIVEMFLSPAVYVLAHRFHAPLITITSLGISLINEHILGGTVLPSHASVWEMKPITESKMSFWKRLEYFFIVWEYIFYTYHVNIHRQQKIAEEYLGPDIPSLLDIQKNVSLVFTNQAEVLSYARPTIANMIKFTSFYPEENLKQLPKDLKRFLDNASEGFILFSLGTIATSSSLPSDTIQIFNDVFAKLPYKVVWKFEKELTKKPDNVFAAPWFHQQSILAHPNIKLFLYQGGIQSSEEAVYFTVPVLGFPILADQDYQVGRMETLGVGKCMDITTLTREGLESAIREIITNKRYKEKMIQVKNLVHDTPYNSTDNLAWWTEYVIRHKGAHHLRSSLTRQPWHQRNDMDIVVFLAVLFYILVSIVISIIVFSVRFYKKRQSSAVCQKKKVN